MYEAIQDEIYTCIVKAIYYFILIHSDIFKTKTKKQKTKNKKQKKQKKKKIKQIK